MQRVIARYLQVLQCVYVPRPAADHQHGEEQKQKESAHNATYRKKGHPEGDKAKVNCRACVPYTCSISSLLMVAVTASSETTRQ